MVDAIQKRPCMVIMFENETALGMEPGEIEGSKRRAHGIAVLITIYLYRPEETPKRLSFSLN